jgi:hypothetical protein
MKKIFFALFLLLAFMACDREREEPKSLAGTNWMVIESGVKIELAFSETQVAVTATVVKNDPQTITGTYTYNHPIIEINAAPYPEYPDFYLFLDKGRVEGDTLSIEMLIGDLGEVLHFQRQ